jgi:adenosylhomocysteine nucleosidase
MIAVTFALPAESSGFLRRLHKQSRNDRNGVRVIHGEIDSRAIEVLHTGVGEKVCRERMANFLQDREFNYLISAGFAGALNDRLQAGDLLIAENFSTVQLTEAHSAFSTLPIHTADLVTVPLMIDSTEERNKIAHTSGAAAVDMETEFIARACAEHGIRLLSLRAISDTPSEPFPAPSNILFDVVNQRTNLVKLAAFFLTRPNRVPRLIQFAKRIARARETLASAIVNVATAL